MHNTQDNHTPQKEGLFHWLSEAANARLVALTTVLLVAGAMLLWPEGRTALVGLGVVALATLRLLVASRPSPALAKATARRRK